MDCSAFAAAEPVNRGDSVNGSTHYTVYHTEVMLCNLWDATDTL